MFVLQSDKAPNGEFKSRITTIVKNGFLDEEYFII